MIYKLASLDKKIKEYIVKSYNTNHSIDEISSSLNVSKNTIVSLLNNEHIDIKREDIPSFRIDSNKVLIISDTHLGNKYENLNYINEAYDMGVKERVGACLHLGDLLQGEVCSCDKKIEQQLYSLDTMYPYVSDFNTYLLMGNHDYKVFENQEAMDILENKSDFKIVGYKRTYFNWLNYMFAMEHKIVQLDDELPLEDCALNFVGHGHELRVRSVSKIKVPTLSDDIINTERGAYPAFLIASLEDDYLDIDVYDFVDNEARLKSRSFFGKELNEYHKVRW